MDLIALWDFDDPAGSEARFRAAAVAADGEERAILLTQVARACGLRGAFAEGHAVLDGVVASSPEVETRTALERGRLCRSAGSLDEATAWFATAAEAATAGGLEGLEIDALHMIPLCLEGTEQFAATLAAVERARSATTVEGQRWLAPLLNNLGMAHADAGEWNPALVAFEEALAERLKSADATAAFVARWMVAWALRNLGRADEAREAQRRLKADLAAAGQSDPYVEEELALLGD